MVIAHVRPGGLSGGAGFLIGAAFAILILLGLYWLIMRAAVQARRDVSERNR